MMKSLLMALVAGAFVVAPVAAKAEDKAAEVVAPATTPAADAAVETAADAAVAAKETTLKDGTKIVIEGEMVSVVGADGAKTPAPDGEHELADGTKVTTKEGKVVPAAAH